MPYIAKGMFTDVIKLGTLRWEGYPRLAGGPKVMTKVLKSERWRQESQKRDARMEAEIGVM